MYTFMIIHHLAQFFIKNISVKRRTENRNTVVYSITSFRNCCRLWDKVETNCRAGQATNDMAHALWILVK